MSRDFRWRRGMLLGTVIMALTATILSATPAASAPPPGPTARGDVYIRDQTSDFGFEPSGGAVWSSPDIKVCSQADLIATTPATCTAVNPLVHGTDYVVVVRMNNPAPTTSVSGNLEVYYTGFGGAAVWPTDWTSIDTVFGLNVPSGGTYALVPWFAADLPTTGTHFCLLARWNSASDPMHNPEGSNTVSNTQWNNNIAWRNIDIIKIKKFELHVVPFILRKPFPDPRPLVTNLVFTQGERPFVGPGRLVVDLGPTLAARWKQNGQRGVGVRPVGETQVEILDPRQATIIGLPINSQEHFETRVSLVAGEATGRFEIRAFQTDQQGTDLGGGAFDITVE